MSHFIKVISYKEILEVWQNKLWKNRTSKIEPNSAMVYLNGYDLKNMTYTPTFLGYFIDNTIVGVNSGHKCYDNSYRSRGLYVDENYRKNGIGKQLLLSTIEQGKLEFADFVWSYPKQSSWKCYQSAGFTLSSEWHLSENDINAYCKLSLDELSKVVS